MKAVVSTCNSCGHCGELHLPTSSDSLSMVNTRKFIVENFKAWIFAHQTKWLPLSNLQKETLSKEQPAQGKGKRTSFQEI